MKKAILITLPTVVVLSAPGLGRAALVTWEFGGEITSVYDENDLLGGQVSIGTPFSGSFTFESTAPDLSDNPNTGNYPALTDFLAYVGGVPVFGAITPFAGITVGNGSPGMVSDGFGVHLVGELLGERVVIDLSLTDESGTVFDSAALPVDPLDLGAFDRATFTVWLAQELPLMRLDGDITSLVPEPTTLVLMGIAGAVVLLRRRAPRIP